MSHHRLHHNTDGSIQALYHPCIPGREVVYLLTTIQTETGAHIPGEPWPARRREIDDTLWRLPLSQYSQFDISNRWGRCRGSVRVKM